MKRKFVSFLVAAMALGATDAINAQQIDPALTATIELQTLTLKDIHSKRKTTQEKIIAAETAVTVALDRVHEVENKMLTYLREAQSVMTNLYQIKRAAELVGVEIPKNITLLTNSVPSNSKALQLQHSYLMRLEMYIPRWLLSILLCRNWSLRVAITLPIQVVRPRLIRSTFSIPLKDIISPMRLCRVWRESISTSIFSPIKSRHSPG